MDWINKIDNWEGATTAKVEIALSEAKDYLSETLETARIQVSRTIFLCGFLAAFGAFLFTLLQLVGTIRGPQWIFALPIFASGVSVVIASFYAARVLWIRPLFVNGQEPKNIITQHELGQTDRNFIVNLLVIYQKNIDQNNELISANAKNVSKAFGFAIASPFAGLILLLLFLYFL